MNHVLIKNNFTFLDKHYLQVHGTAMGTRMAPSMACLFMGKLEERMLASAPCRPWMWWRYIIHTSDRLQRAIPVEPMIAFRCPPSPTNLLTRAEVPPTNDSSIPPIQHGMFRCTSRCVTCQEHILESDSFKSHTTGAHHKIRGHITCTTSNIIYLISCRICGIQYIGETKNLLKKRFYGHRSTVKTQKLDTPVGRHFNLPNHSISDMILQGIEALANHRESVRLSREKMWIKRVHTIHPHGLNIQEGND